MKAHELSELMKMNPEGFGSDKEDGLWWSKTLNSSHKFDFGAMLADNIPVSLSDFGYELVYAGIFRLPFDDVYFETSIGEGGKKRLAVLAMQVCDDEGCAIIVVRPYVRDLRDRYGWGHYGGVICVKVPSSPIPPSDKYPIMDGRIVGIRMDPNLTKTGVEQDTIDGLQIGLLYGLDFLMAGVVAMNAKGTTVQIQSAPEKLNRKRQKLGRSPIYEHRIVTIGDQSEMVRYAANAEPSLRSSPRMHWRRGHIRHLSSGRMIPVSPALVGLSENGAISHEYRIRKQAGDTNAPAC